VGSPSYIVNKVEGLVWLCLTTAVLNKVCRDFERVKRFQANTLGDARSSANKEESKPRRSVSTIVNSQILVISLRSRRAGGKNVLRSRRRDLSTFSIGVSAQAQVHAFGRRSPKAVAWHDVL
jgi:hypothetical protein